MGGRGTPGADVCVCGRGEGGGGGGGGGVLGGHGSSLAVTNNKNVVEMW